MSKPITDEALSITTQKTQALCLNGKDALPIRNKRVAIVGDVISTGESLSAIERLVERAGASVVARTAIIAEGDAAKCNDIIFLEELPFFFRGEMMRTRKSAMRSASRRSCGLYAGFTCRRTVLKCSIGNGHRCRTCLIRLNRYNNKSWLDLAD